MNQGDTVRVTMKDTRAGLLTKFEDLTTGASGYMVTSAANGFQNTDLHTCAGTNFSFHPEFATARLKNSLPWGANAINVDYSPEIGHFQPGLHGDGDGDDAPCFSGPVVAGCFGGDLDFDGTSYQTDWPDGTSNTPISITIRSVLGNGIGPVSAGHGYTRPYPSMQFTSLIAEAEPGCSINPKDCVMPPKGAQFYPFYAVSQNGSDCFMTFGNDIAGSTTNDFGKDAQYGSISKRRPLAFQSGRLPSPCTPN